MHSKLTAVSLCLALSGCSSVRTSSGHMWRASVSNGDKPGIGIELVRTAEGVQGFMYLLDPNKPHNFAVGSRRNMEIQSATEQEIRFAVQWLPAKRDDMVLRFDTPLVGTTVRGVLQSADGQGEPQDYECARIR